MLVERHGLRDTEGVPVELDRPRILLQNVSVAVADVHFQGALVDIDE